jgi:hypothetical protein
MRARAPALPVFTGLVLFSSAEPGTGKWPVFGMLAQSCFHWIVLDVTHGLREVLRIPDVTIKIIQHPELSFSVKDSIGLVRGDGLEGVHNSCQRVVFKPGRQQVNVIRHDDPCREAIASSIRTEHYILNHRSYARLLHESLAVSLIQVFFNTSLQQNSISFAVQNVSSRFQRASTEAGTELNKCNDTNCGTSRPSK